MHLFALSLRIAYICPEELNGQLYLCKREGCLLMKRFLIYFLFSLAFSSQCACWAQDGKDKDEWARQRQESRVMVIPLSESQVQVKHAEPGTRMEVYSILGVRIASVRIESDNQTVSLNLPRGYYIFKIGNVVRRVVIK